MTLPTPVTEEWTGRDVTVAGIERELARLRGESRDGNSGLRTSVMTHIAWVPPRWLAAAEATLAGMGELHPSRTLVLIPDERAPDGLDAEISVRCYPLGETHVCGEVIQLHLRGNRGAAPASIVLPLVISDLPVFCRWRGLPAFGERPWEQLVDVADRLIVDSSEWDTPGYGLLAGVFERTAVSDLAWARLYEWRVELARYWPGIAEQEIRVRGPWAEASLLRAWLNARLARAIRPVEAAEELGVRLGGEDLPRPSVPTPDPSHLLSAELDRFDRDPIFEEAVRAAAYAQG